MTLSERQQLAKRLAGELGKMNDVWVTSPMPLDDNAKLRFQVSDAVKNEVMQMLRDWGWEPKCISILPRVCSTGLMAACLYEIDFPKPRQPIIDDRIHGEIANKDHDAYKREAQRMIEHIYGKQR